MREIKFRAWDEEDQESKIMIYSDKRNKGDYLIDYDFTINKNGEVICIWTEDYDDKFGYSAARSGQLNNLMQYTGLKDCNDNEIYEGDIVRVEVDEILTVIFNEGAFCAKGDSYIVPLLEIADECEIIGNIYENPELSEDN